MATDAWMDKMIGVEDRQQDKVDDEPYAKLELFFWRPPISRSKCPDMILLLRPNFVKLKYVNSSPSTKVKCYEGVSLKDYE